MEIKNYIRLEHFVLTIIDEPF